MRQLICLTVTLAAAHTVLADAQQDQGSGRDAVVSLKFEGGTLAEYVAAIKSRAPGANIIVREEAADVPVGSIELTSVALEPALQLLEGHFPDGDTVYDVDIEFLGGGPSMPVFVVECQWQTGFSQVEQSRVEVFAVDDVLSGEIDEEALLTVIETTLNMTDGGTENVDLRFHDATGILVAKATPTQIQAVKQVLSQLRESAERRQIRRNQDQEHERWQRMYHEAAQRSEMLTQELHEVERRAVASETQMQLVESDSERFRQHTADMEANVLVLTRRIAELESVIANLESALQAARDKQGDG